MENVFSAVTQIRSNGMLSMAVLGNILSIAFFNYFGISVTQSMSATHRMVLDSIRTLVIWVFSLLVGWQSFAPLQVVGFTVLLFGTLIYNEMLLLPGVEGSGGSTIDLESVIEEDEADSLLPSASGLGRGGGRSSIQ